MFPLFWKFCLFFVYANICVAIIDYCTSSHCGAAGLTPVCVPKLKNIIIYNFLEHFGDKYSWIVIFNCCFALLSSVPIPVMFWTQIHTVLLFFGPIWSLQFIVCCQSSASRKISCFCIVVDFLCFKTCCQYCWAY